MIFEFWKGYVICFSKKCPSTVSTKSALDSVGQFFLKMMLGDMSQWGTKKVKGEWRESTIDDAMIVDFSFR